MPTYDYACKNCGHHFEQFQSITAEPLKECPKCKKEVVRLISSGSGFIFKGAGFYATDYRKGSPGPASCPSAGSQAGCSGCPGA
ncbi:MAG: FmdB family zinc ribbon protein [Candidatus Omnitrophota bacterium]